MSEDDEVLYAGHELHRYLNQLGFTDFEVVQHVGTIQNSPAESDEDDITSEEENNSSENDIPLGIQLSHYEGKAGTIWCKEPPNVMGKNACSKHFDRATWCKDHRCGVEIAVVKELIQYLNPIWLFSSNKTNKFLQLEIETLLESGLLLEEDYNFLQNLISPMDFVMEKPLWTGTSLLTGLLLSGCMFMWKKNVLHGFFPFLYSILTAEHFVSEWQNSLQRTRLSELVNKLLIDCKSLYSLHRKSLHFVKENELLYRGFTLTKSSSSTLQLEKITASYLAKRWYLMSGLRISIATSALGAINTLQSATQKLVMDCPLSGQLDNRSHYIAYLSKEDLGIADINIADDSEFSLGILKNLHQVYLHLQSEFIRRLALCFVGKLRKHSEQNIQLVFAILSEVCDQYFETICNLNENYKFFSCYGLHNGKYVGCKQLQISTRKNFSAYIGIHSTILHLQGILHRTKETEELVGKQSDDNEDISRNVLKELTDIVTEIESCKSCIEVAIGHLTDPTPTDIVAEGKKMLGSLSHGIGESGANDREPILVGYTDLNPPVQDEIFETIVTHDLGSSVDDDDGLELEYLTPADQIKRRIEEECSKRMLLELKTVLVHKAKEWELREAKALKNKDLKAKVKIGMENIFPSKYNNNINQIKVERSESIDTVSSKDSRWVEGVIADIGENSLSVPDTMRSISNDANEDPFISLAIKPGQNWPLPRLKARILYRNRRPSSGIPVIKIAETDMSCCFLGNVAPVKTLIVDASESRHNLGCVVNDEEIFCGSGENSTDEFETSE